MMLLVLLLRLCIHAWNIFKYQIVCRRFLQNERHDKWALPAVSQKSIQAHSIPIVHWSSIRKPKIRMGRKTMTIKRHSLHSSQIWSVHVSMCVYDLYKYSWHSASIVHYKLEKRSQRLLEFVIRRERKKKELCFSYVKHMHNMPSHTTRTVGCAPHISCVCILEKQNFNNNNDNDKKHTYKSKNQFT